MAGRKSTKRKNPTNRFGHSFKKGDAVQRYDGVYQGLYIKLQPATSFTRAYGPQALVWHGAGPIPKGATLGSPGVQSIGLGDIKPAMKKNPLTVNPFKTMSEVRGAHKAAGLHFFDKGAGKMFGEVALKGPYRGHYVVSQQVMTFDDGIPRRKGVVSYFADDGSKRHVKTFEGPSSWTDAVDFAKGKGAAKSNPLTVNPKHWAIYNSTSGAELGTYPGSSASAAWKNLMKDVGGRYQAPGPDIVIKPVHKLRARKNPLTVNPRHVGAAKPPGTVVIEDNVHKVPGYIVVTHAQVALAQRHAPGIAPLASLVTTDKGGPGRKAKRWHRWFLPESIKAQPWATASIKRRNPAKRRKNPMGDTWAIMSAADVMRANPLTVNPRKAKAPASPKWVHVKTFTRPGMAPRVYNATDVDDAVRIVKKELMAGDHVNQVSIHPLVGHGIGDGFDVNVSYSTSLMGSRHMKSFTFLPIQ